MKEGVSGLDAEEGEAASPEGERAAGDAPEDIKEWLKDLKPDDFLKEDNN